MQQIMQPISVLRDQFSEIAVELDKTLTLASSSVAGEKQEVEDDDDGFEFSFAGGNPNSPVSAEEIFQNGQIRPLFPFSDEQGLESEEAEGETTSYAPPVRKVFVVRTDRLSAPTSTEDDDMERMVEGLYCDWSASTPAPAQEMSRKSNSTGLSKLWRVRELLIRSNSDGKDTFVFLTGKNEGKVERVTASLYVEEEKKKMKMGNVAKIKEVKSETASLGEKKGKQKQSKSAYEVLYGKKDKEKKGGKSYLPYRKDLVGFFTNVNGMSRNIHPY